MARAITSSSGGDGCSEFGLDLIGKPLHNND